MQCPPGQQITPTLVATYHKLKETRRDFEFIYVSSDRTEEEWKTSLASMPWLSFHYGDERPEAIRKSFHIDCKCLVHLSVGLMDSSKRRGHVTRHLAKFKSRLKIVKSTVCIVQSRQQLFKYYKPLSDLNFARYYGSYMPSSPLGSPLVLLNYCRLGFDYEILMIVNYEFLNI